MRAQQRCEYLFAQTWGVRIDPFLLQPDFATDEAPHRLDDEIEFFTHDSTSIHIADQSANRARHWLQAGRFHRPKAPVRSVLHAYARPSSVLVHAVQRPRLQSQKACSTF